MNSFTNQVLSLRDQKRAAKAYTLVTPFSQIGFITILLSGVIFSFVPPSLFGATIWTAVFIGILRGILNPFLGFLGSVFLLGFTNEIFEIAFLKPAEALLIVAGAGLLIRQFVRHDRIYFHPAFYVVWIYMIAIILSLFSATYFTTSIIELIRIGVGCVLLFFTVQFATTETKITSIVNIYVSSALFYSVVSYVSAASAWLGSEASPLVTWGHGGSGRFGVVSLSVLPATSASFLLFPAFLLMTLLLDDNIRREPHRIAKLALLLILGAILLTGSRAGWLALGLGTLILLFLLGRRRLAFSIIVFAIFTSIIILPLGLSYIQVRYPDAYSRFGLSRYNIQYIMSGQRTEPRLVLWQNALENGLEHPLIGIGLRNFKGRASDLVVDTPLAYLSRGEHNIHNTYLSGFVETGVVGFLSLCFMFLYFLLRAAFNTKLPNPTLRPISYAILVAIVAAYVQGMFLEFVTVRHLWLLFGINVSIARVIVNSSHERMPIFQ